MVLTRERWLILLESGVCDMWSLNTQGLCLTLVTELQEHQWAKARAPFRVLCLLGAGDVLAFLLADGKLEQQENLLQN